MARPPSDLRVAPSLPQKEYSSPDPNSFVEFARLREIYDGFVASATELHRFIDSFERAVTFKQFISMKLLKLVFYLVYGKELFYSYRMHPLCPSEFAVGITSAPNIEMASCSCESSRYARCMKIFLYRVYQRG